MSQISDPIFSEVAHATARAVRQPPYDVEAEQALLGAILNNNMAIDKVIDLLKPEHFSDGTHRRIYELCLSMYGHGDTADPITLRRVMGGTPELERVGGGGYLDRLAASVVGIINAEQYGRLIYELYIRRQLIGLGEDVVNESFDDTLELNADQRIAKTEESLYQLATTGETARGFTPFKTALKLSLEMADAAHKASGLSGVTTGLIDLDNLLGGLHNSDLIILAGRPGMGKTALATSIAYNAAYAKSEDPDGPGAVTAFFSLEMSAEQLATRILSNEAQIPGHKMRTGKMTQDDFNKLGAAVGALEKVPLFIDDTPGLTVGAIRTRARRLQRQANLGLVVIDYLQLLSPGVSSRRESNRVQELSEMTRGLKILAKELNVPVLVLSQLSRAVESRDDKHPQLSDLRESGSIEQDADMVIFVYREHYYKKAKRPQKKDGEDEGRHARALEEWEDGLKATEFRAEAIVAKQRHGPTDTVVLHFNGEYTTFGNWTDDDHLPYGG
ncbi:replicative DNA helicase [Oleispirillum naphthae]|uniref:replicative DNA helicase n=1 Tax=Oleispirillum naphthae TaxID=2838853 RepID=UPI00308266FB